MKENVLTSFIRDTYKTTSIIPYFITGQVILFILLHIFDLLTFSQTTSLDLYTLFYQNSVLPIRWSDFMNQPWSLLSHPFIYTSIWTLLFDCLWLYWSGNLFFTFLNKRQFNTVFLGGISMGSIILLSMGFIPYFNEQPYYWSSSQFGLAAVISALLVLVPNSEIRLFLIGNVKYKWIASIYLGVEFALLISTNKAAALTYLLIVFGGMIFMYQLQNGKDWSLAFKYADRKKLKVVKTNNPDSKKKNDKEYPNQQEIDQILDKISLKGYESLTSQEKSILFRASKKED